MSNTKEKIISSQAIANDLEAEVSAMLTQQNYDEKNLRMLYNRIKDLSSTLNSIDTHGAKF
ncbi:MAG: hypothetical protein ACLFUB_05775 [Cyclobacteriaceae bacterium]